MHSLRDIPIFINTTIKLLFVIVFLFYSDTDYILCKVKYSELNLHVYNNTDSKDSK